MTQGNFNLTRERKELQVVMDRIKSLQIQGATEVAVQGVRAFGKYAESLKGSKEDVCDHLLKIRREMSNLRATEPTLRNGLKFILSHIEKNGKDIAVSAALEFENMIEKAKQEIFRVGAERIQPGSTLMTHCHSSITVGMMLEAAKTKKFKVISSETRPKYQGRTTSKKLVNAGIECIHIVDSAMRWALSKFNVSLLLLGADSVTAEGVAINKIGSRLAALSADEEHIPLYIGTSLLKYDPETNIGRLSEIEMRSPVEIWKNPPDGLKILNPAFETIDRTYIAAYITEYGVVPPQSVHHVFDVRLKPLLEAG